MTHYDLIVVGSGSGNSVVPPAEAGWTTAVVEDGVFGGTCLNVGCIPTKMYVYAAGVADQVRSAARFGVDATLDGVRWADVRDRIFTRIDAISAAGETYRRDGRGTALYRATARFTGPRALRLSTGEDLTADRVVIAAGARPVVPEVVAQSGVPFLTSDTIMRLDRRPERLVILGGGYVGAEFAHVFSAFGSAVTVITRGHPLLRAQDREVARRFTRMAEQQWDVRLDARVSKVEGDEQDVQVHLHDGSVVRGDALLVAVGRRPNGDRLDLAAAGVEVEDDGRVAVDDQQRTTAEGVWALGDVSSPYQLKHVANHETRVVAHNLLHPDDPMTTDHRFVPSAVFSRPQIASVGLTEDQARAAQHDYVVAEQDFGGTAYGWAMEDTHSFCKLLADRATGLLLGAHIMGPQASTLIQPLIQAMSFGQSARGLARGQYWIHPALSEVVENALLRLDL